MPYRQLSQTVWVAPQVRREDLEAAARQGVQRIICNRPDGEDPDQATAEATAEAARGLGLEFVWAPVAGMPTSEAVRTVAEALADDRPTLLYCRSGTRSAITWALAMRSLGRGEPEDLRAAAAEAGYDLSRLPL